MAEKHKTYWGEVEHQGKVIGVFRMIKGQRWVGQHEDGYITSPVVEPSIAADDVIHYHVFLKG